MSMEEPLPETLIAWRTPAGVGAIATLGICGPRAWETVRDLVQPRAGAKSVLPADPKVGRLWLGRIGKEAADHVVVSVTAIEPVPCVEVHCHGGREVIRLLLETFAAHGLRICSWQEFEARTAGDPLRAAATVALADAATVRTAGILLDQHHGAFGRAIREVLSSWDGGDHERSEHLLRSLVRYAGVGRHLTVPWRLVVAGAPNVGKSSLINALAGYPRCVVAATPGTTRDLVTTFIAIDGWPVELTDTAGLRATEELLEQQGIDLAHQAICSADLCLWILDASAAPVWPEVQTETMRFVINKVDLEPAWDLNQADDAVRISALRNTGLDELCDAISRWLVPEPPPAEGAVPFTVHLAAQVEEAWRYQTAGQSHEARRVLAGVVRGNV
jgi:tRNA modification GTPase